MENIQRENHENMILDVVFRYLTNKCQCTDHDQGAQWLRFRVLDSRPRACGFDPHRRHCVVILSKTLSS